MNSQIVHSLHQAFAEPTSDSAAAEWLEFEDDTPLERTDPAADSVIAVDDGPLGLIELILKNPVQLDRLIRQPHQQAKLLPRFLAISLICFTFFGVALSLVLSATSVWPHLFSIDSFITRKQSDLMQFQDFGSQSFAAPWTNGNAFRLIAAYAVGLIAATGICLPSLYFYGLLAGVRMTMMDVVLQSLKSKAVAAVTLVGILPIYAALGLAIAIFPIPVPARDAVLLLGLILPFIAGLSGTFSLYRGLSMLTDTMEKSRRVYRECFLQRLVLSWCAVYSAVSPVLIFTLWQRLQG